MSGEDLTGDDEDSEPDVKNLASATRRTSISRGKKAQKNYQESDSEDEEHLLGLGRPARSTPAKPLDSVMGDLMDGAADRKPVSGKAKAFEDDDDDSEISDFAQTFDQAR